jgi:hypothetical protein
MLCSLDLPAATASSGAMARAQAAAEARGGGERGAVAAAPHTPSDGEGASRAGRFVGARGALALRRYKYSCVDRSLIAPFLQPWWTRFVHVFPLWVAPNCITCGGLALIVLSCALAWATSPQLDSALSPGIMLTHAGLLFMYQTLDAVDGKQARCACVRCVSAHRLRCSRSGGCRRQHARPGGVPRACGCASAGAAR